MSQKVNITSPVGRIVMGSLYTPSTTDAEGKPLVVKFGPNAGQPRVNYFFALAIPKNPGETHWASTPWGQQIWNMGHAAFPGIAAAPTFAWKIENGDSQIPNKKGRKPCDNEGWKGNWIIKLSGGFAPKIFRQEGAGYVQITEKDYIKPGYYVEVAFSVDSNESNQTPGVYLNHSMVCFRAYGPEISFGPDVNSAGFGAAPLPAGASAVPLPGSVPMPAAAPTVPTTVAPPPIPVAVTPNVGFVQVPPPAVAPPATTPIIPTVAVAPPPAPPAAKTMTAAANGIPYASYIAQGWTDAQLVANGLMLA